MSCWKLNQYWKIAKNMLLAICVLIYILHYKFTLLNRYTLPHMLYSHKSSITWRITWRVRWRVTWRVTWRITWFSVFGSVVVGFVSWRNSEQGSWFIQAMCEVFLNKYKYEDALNMLVEVWRLSQLITCVVSLAALFHFKIRVTCIVFYLHCITQIIIYSLSITFNNKVVI